MIIIINILLITYFCCRMALTIETNDHLFIQQYSIQFIEVNFGIIFLVYSSTNTCINLQ